MSKSHKVISVCSEIECIELLNRQDPAPYRVYYRPDRYHRRQVGKFPDMISVLTFVRDFYREGVNSMFTSDIISWCSDYQRKGEI